LARPDVRGVPMETLRAADQLDAPEDQVERPAPARVGRVGMAVERAMRGRVALHQDEGPAVLALPPLTPRALVRRAEVGLVGRRPRDLEGVAEVERRDLLGN